MREEEKARALRSAGFDVGIDGKDLFSLQYQNANNSVRVSDEFMEAVEKDLNWELVSRTTGQVTKSVKARELFRKIAEAAWRCADPGIQFDSTINKWHTTPISGRINGSNPCSEYMHLDDSACNLSSLNLLAFLNRNAEFDVDGFRHAVRLMISAQEMLVSRSHYPTEKIKDNANLVSTENEKSIWSNNFDLNVDEVFDVQDKIAEEIVSTIVGRVEADALNNIKTKRPENMDSYDLVLQGLEYAKRGNVIKENTEKAVELFEKAIEAEPSYARAHAWRACTLGNFSRLGRETRSQII